MIHDIYANSVDFAEYLVKNGKTVVGQFASKVNERFGDVPTSKIKPFAFYFNTLAQTVALNLEAESNPLSTLDNLDAILGFIKRFFKFLEDFN